MPLSDQPLNILQCGASLYDWGGIERYIVYLVQGLTERGHAVTTAAPANSPLAQRLPHTEINLRHRYDFRAWAAYIRLLKSQRFDLCHVHYSPDFVGVGYAARTTKTPAIMTRHLPQPWQKGKAKVYGKLYKHIIPVSDAVRIRLEESGILSAQMTVAKAGVPALMPTKTYHTTNETLQVGFFGRLVIEKGVEVLTEAVTGTKIQAHIYGDGPAHESLQKGSPQNATFHGFVDSVTDSMAAMDVIAIPSTWEEAFPYSALEAMSLGKPIVASRIGGLPEIVNDPETGRLFTPRNATELRKILLELDANRPALQTMGDKARQIHQSEYTLQRMAERIEAVYRANI